MKIIMPITTVQTLADWLDKILEGVDVVYQNTWKELWEYKKEISNFPKKNICINNELGRLEKCFKQITLLHKQMIGLCSYELQKYRPLEEICEEAREIAGELLGIGHSI